MIENKEFRVRTEDKEKAINYFESISENYNQTVSRGILKLARDRERQSVLKLAELNRPGTTLADVGCGAGFYSIYAKNQGMVVHSFDSSPGMIKKLASQVDHAQVVDIETMDTSHQFDTVICAGVLDFVLQPEKAFSNLCKLVAPKGRLVVMCPRVGIGGLFSRLEKFFFGIRVNLYQAVWLSHLASREGLTLTKTTHALPVSMTLLFERH